MPSRQSSYLEKCRTIISEIDSILKQFKLYVEDGMIDHELLTISSDHLFLKDIPSLLKNKYIYANGEEFKVACHYLFSDQSTLNFVPNIGDHYSNFYNLIRNENIVKEHFKQFQKDQLQWLKDYNYIFLDMDGIIRLNTDKVNFIKDLYYNEVSRVSHWRGKATLLDSLFNNGMIEYESTLLSRPEQNYFNYLLNKSEYSNGLDLRNRYVHGTQSIDKSVHEQDYYTFLRILILIVIKINEEFCLWHSDRKISGENLRES